MSRRDFDPENVHPDGRRAARGSVFDPSRSGPWRGSCPGDAFGSPVTILAYGNDKVGEGRRLHVHPYGEVFVVIAGAARVLVGDDIIDAMAGDAVFGPAGVPHRFENLGRGRLQTLDIHHSPDGYRRISNSRVSSGYIQDDRTKRNLASNIR